MRKVILLMIGLIVLVPLYGQQKSHVAHHRARVETVSVDDLVSGGRDAARLSTRYFDGLGRPEQEVSRQASPSGADMVQPYFYDFAGRESREYLPYPRGGGDHPGGFRPRALTEQRSFYRNNFDGEERAFTVHTYEASSMGRVNSSLGPGHAWREEEGRASTQARRPNRAGDGVRIWTLDGEGLPTSAGTYGAGTLWRTESKDPEGKRRVEYSDMEGHTVLVKVQESNSPSSQHAGWLCTYYVYDALGDLRVVMPPKAIRFLTGAWGRSREKALVEGQYYLYTYDHQGRMTIEKIPGRAARHHVHDRRDRLVATQDGKLRAEGSWHIYKYDALNRRIQEGLVKDMRSRASLQKFFDDLGVENNGRVEAQLSPSGTQYRVVGGFPSAEGNMLAMNLYDGPFAPGLDDYVKPSGFGDPSKATRGMLTGRVERVLEEGGKTLGTSFFYDREGRLIQELKRLGNGGTLRTSTSFNFEGQALRKLEQLRGPVSATLRQRYSYNRSGHPSLTRIRVNNEAEHVLARYSYDRLGRLSGKNFPLAGVSVSQGHHLRGWPLWMEQRHGGELLFSWRLYYESGVSPARWDGNISAASWRGRDGVGREYHYRYDEAARLRGGAYLVPNRSEENHRYTTGWNTYDANGNLLTLRRSNQAGSSTYAYVDDLRFEYEPHGNRVTRIRDSNGSTSNISMDFKPSSAGGSYGYDPDGNLLTNPDRGITRVTYNHLDLPSEIRHPGGRVETVYLASGTKLSQKRYSGSKLGGHWEWAGSFVIKDGQLHHINHPEGRVVPSDGGGFYYDFYARDHLGSLRQVLRAPSYTYVTATMEAGAAVEEEKQFGMLAQSRQGAAEHNTTPGGNRVAWLNASAGRVLGPVRVQEVSEGEQVQLSVNGKYRAGGTAMFRPEVFAAPGARAGVLAGLPDPSQLATSTHHTAILGVVAVLAAALQTKPAPEAYLMYQLFDGSGVRYKSGKLALDKKAEGKHMVLKENVYIEKDGRLEAFLVNESGVDVWFDDFQVGTCPPLVIEETHYDPWGVELSGLGYRYNGERQGEEGFNGKDLLHPPGLYDYGARLYDPVVGRWWSVDPLAGHREQVSPYNFVQNNPLNRIDPDGRFDWAINKDNEVYWDENATSPETTKKGEIYLGKMGFGIDEQTGNTFVYNPDGVVSEGVRSLPEVTVTSGNPVQDAIYMGNKAFALGALDLTSQTFGNIGASATVTGLIVAPFAPPVGAGLITIGETLSAISGTASAVFNLSQGNVGAAFTDAAVLSVGSFGSAGIKSLEGGVINSTEQYLLRATQNTSLEITNQLIMPAFLNRKK